MKAATRNEYGLPDVLTVKDLPTPQPKNDELLIKVMATTVNRTDCAILTGKPFVMRLLMGLFRPGEPVPGTDFAGIVEETGAGVTAFKKGDKVWGFNDNGLASQAEYLCISTQKPVIKMPGNLSFEQAAASAEGAHYAVNFLNKVKIKPGQQVLVNGATGAIGSALLQFLNEKKVHTTAVCRAESAALVQALGAERVIDYTSTDFTKEPGTYDFIFDTVGKSTYYQCRKRLAPNGIYISSELGPYSQNLFLPILAPLKRGKKVRFPLPLNKVKSLQFIAGQIRDEKFRPVIDRTFPLEEVQAAYRYVMGGQKIGNVILSIAGEPLSTTQK